MSRNRTRLALVGIGMLVCRPMRRFCDLGATDAFHQISEAARERKVQPAVDSSVPLTLPALDHLLAYSTNHPFSDREAPPAFGEWHGDVDWFVWG